MPKRVVFDATDEQVKRFISLGEREKEIGIMARKAFEEWLKRREARSRRADEHKVVTITPSVISEQQIRLLSEHK